MSDKFKFSLACLSILIVLIPYGGEGYYKLSNLIIFTCQVMIIAILLSDDGKIKIKHELKVLSILFLIMLFWQSFVNAYVAIVVGYEFSYSDLSEFIRTFQTVFPIFCLCCLSFESREKMEYIIFLVLILSFSHAFLMLLPKFTIAFDSMIELYGEGHYYTAGYARYRGFGIIGQPGKAGMFGVLCIIIGMIHYHIYQTCKFKILGIIFFSLLAIGISLSRTSLILVAISILFLIKSTRVKIILLMLVTTSILYFVLKDEELVELLTRGFDIQHGQYATASHRMVLKEWAFNFISQRYDTVITGVGDTKDYISRFTHPYAFDLSLRTPDSSQTVWLVRFGLVGVFIGYLPLLYMLYTIAKANISVEDKKFILLVPFLIFIYSFLDPFYHDPKILIISSLLYVYFYIYLNVKIKR
ncbi:hypothetical protein F2K80_003203 [Vibrio fluvialis]|nr:hypothetical protein [Vibrio fluvialis]